MFDLGIRVLLVDDMNTMRKILGSACREIGFKNLDEAIDGNNAWNVLQSPGQPFGLIICDINMPNSNGLEFLKRARADARFKSTPFVFITSESDHALIADAVRAGVDNYIVKPFTVETLKRKLQETHKRLSEKPAVVGS